jgi:hypothetical protein
MPGMSRSRETESVINARIGGLAWDRDGGAAD